VERKRLLHSKPVAHASVRNDAHSTVSARHRLLYVLLPMQLQLLLLSTHNWQLTTGNSQLATHNWQPTTGNYQEATTTFTPFFSSCLINEGGASSSVITYCTSPISHILPIPLFPNFVLSANMTTLCAALIIF